MKFYFFDGREQMEQAFKPAARMRKLLQRAVQWEWTLRMKITTKLTLWSKVTRRLRFCRVTPWPIC